MSTVLEIKNLCKEYPKFKLDNVSFSIEQGTIMGFVGRNGAGKSTTLRSLLSFVHPDSGEIKIFGKNFKDAEDEIKKRIGYASSGTDYYPRKQLKKIIENQKMFYENWSDEACEKYMEKFELDENKKIMELSEGMKVKFHLVLALSHGAELLILDEPTSGLDPVSREELVIIFKELAKEGVTILFSTHITSDLEKCADSVTYIQKGKILSSKPMDRFMADFAPDITTLEDIMVHLELNKN